MCSTSTGSTRMRLKIKALQAIARAAAQQTRITFLPARVWSSDPSNGVITYPQRAITSWLRDWNPLVDIGPEPRGVIAARRIESLFARLGRLLAEGVPASLQEDAVVHASSGFSPEQIISMFWHAEHGRIEAALRAAHPRACELGFFPAYGVDWRVYSYPALPVQIYGAIANPKAPNTNPQLVDLLEPVRFAKTRVESWAALLRILPSLPSWDWTDFDALHHDANVDQDYCGGYSDDDDDEDDEDGDSFFGGSLFGSADNKQLLSGGGLPRDSESWTAGYEPKSKDVPFDERTVPPPDDPDYPQLTRAEALQPIDPVIGRSVLSEDVRYSDDATFNVGLDRAILAPTMERLERGLSRIAGMSRSSRVVLRNRYEGMLDSSRLVRSVANRRTDCFRRVRCTPYGSRLSMCFLVDDSGSMGAASAITFPGRVNQLFPNMREIDAIRLLALALSEVTFKLEGQCAVTTINHPTVTRWIPSTTAKAVARFIADGGSEPDAGLKSALARLNELPGPRIVVFLTDGAVITTDAIAANAPLIPVVPAHFASDTLYGHPVVRMDANFIESFTARTSEVVARICAAGRSVA